MHVALPFPWRTTTGRCLPGILRLISQMASGRRGIFMPELCGKLTFRPNLCYFATCEKNWLREEDCLGDFTRAKRLQKPFWYRGSQGYRIISAYISQKRDDHASLGDSFLFYSYYRWVVRIYRHRGRCCGYCQNLVLYFPHSLCRFLNSWGLAAKSLND